MDSLPIPDHIKHLVLTTTQFATLPDPSDIMVNGGLPGVEYALVLGQNVGYYTDPTLPEQERWELVRQPHVFRIGPCNNVLIICRGRPIRGADNTSSTRVWWTDPELIEMLREETEPPLEALIEENAKNGDAVDVDIS